MNEFDVINTFFKRDTRDEHVIVGSGDDGAVIHVPNVQQLVVSTDALQVGVHFPEDTTPEDIAYKAVAVSLSDMAAMGAAPKWLTMTLSVPSVENDWMQAFSKGLFACLDAFHVQLVGGDLTRGVLTVTTQALGLVPNGCAITRTGAHVGDGIFVTGTLGDAGLGLRDVAQRQRLNRPTPRVAAGIAIRDIATAAIDVSDGLLGDIQHLFNTTVKGATIHAHQLPLSDAVRAAPDALELALTAGDDFELCFTAPLDQQPLLESALSKAGCTFTHIGTMDAQDNVRVVGADGERVNIQASGFKHFG